jgi:hypothetical protein
VAATVEDSSRFNNQARGVNLARNYSMSLNLDPSLGEYHPVKSAGNYDLIALDLPFDLGPLAQNQRLTAEDVSLDLGLDPERAGELQSPLKAHRPVKEAGPLALRVLYASI